MNAIVLPSLLSAPFDRLGDSIRELEQVGVSLFHYDVMDGHFVPNLTIGPLIIKSLQPHISSQFDAHLMVTNPETQLAWFDLPSVRSLSIHIEASKNLDADLKTIQSFNKKAGIVINPPTEVEKLDPYLEKVDQILVMSVHPGFGGQKFMENSLPKIEYLANRKSKEGFEYQIQVDGGINKETIRWVYDAGATEIVAGDAVFNTENPPETYRRLMSIIGN